VRGRATWRELSAVFVLSLVLAMAMFHAAWAHPMTTQVGGAGDADEYSWFLSWMPFALGHGLNPLVSHYVAYPGGVNLMWNTSIVFPSFVMAPFTLVFGAAFSYNILITSAPTLCATFGYLAFRRWTAPLPALAGALLFGFSPYMVSQSPGHLAQALIMSAPLVLVLGDRLLVVQSGIAWRDGLLLGLLAWAQLLTGEEVFAMEAVTALAALVVLGLIARHQIAAHLPYARKGSIVAAGVFAVLSVPFLAFQYLGPYRVQDVHPPNVYVSDLLNFVVPTNITKFAPKFALDISQHFTGNGAEQGAYVGIPLLIFVLVAVFLGRHRTVTWVAAAVGAAGGILSMGPYLHVDGSFKHPHVRLPDDVLQHLPFFHNLLPDRFASMMTLGAGMLVALGLDQLKFHKVEVRAVGWAVVVVGLVLLTPITDFPAASSPLYTAFTTGFSCPPASAKTSSGLPPVVLVVPTTNEMDLRWEAESKFCFVLPSDTGMTGTNSAYRKGLGILFNLGDPAQPMQPTTPALRAQAAQEIAQFDIKEIVVGPEFPTSPPWDPDGQAEAVAWMEWLLGQAPLQSHDPYISYVWNNLPPVSDIASGHVGTVQGEA
jgi:hypothetical protein